MYFRALVLTGFVVCLLTPWRALAIPPGVVTHGAAFAQLSSSVDQKPGGIVQFETKDSLQKISATANSAIVTQGGSYLIIASPQVTATKDGGCLDAWIVVNGQNVKNSGVRLCQARAGNTNVVVSQVMMNLKKGDKIQVKTSGKDVKLDAINPQGEPQIPSIIFTVLGLY